MVAVCPAGGGQLAAVDLQDELVIDGLVPAATLRGLVRRDPVARQDLRLRVTFDRPWASALALAAA